MKFRHLAIFMSGFTVAIWATDASWESALYECFAILTIGLLWWAIDNIDDAPWGTLRKIRYKATCTVGRHDWGVFSDNVFCYGCGIEKQGPDRDEVSMKQAERASQVLALAWNIARERNPDCNDESILKTEVLKVIDEAQLQLKETTK